MEAEPLEAHDQGPSIATAGGLRPGSRPSPKHSPRTTALPPYVAVDDVIALGERVERQRRYVAPIDHRKFARRLRDSIKSERDNAGRRAAPDAVTIAVSTNGWPDWAEFVDMLRAVAGGGAGGGVGEVTVASIVAVTLLEALDAKVASPEKDAVTVWVPAESVEVVERRDVLAGDPVERDDGCPCRRRS